MVPAGRPVVSLLPPGNIKMRFFVPEAVLPKIALGDGGDDPLRRLQGRRLTAKVSFISRSLRSSRRR